MFRILITGGSGLLAVNWAMAVRDRFEVTLGLHQRSINPLSAKTLFVDLESVVQIEQEIEKNQFDLVIHAAGLTSVEKCEADPDLAWRANVVAAANVARVCAALSVPHVHVSTDHLFSGEWAMLDEKALVSPVNIYGRTKAEAERHVLEINPLALVIRTNFYGWGSSYRQSFSDVVIDSLRSHATLTLYEDVHYTPILAATMIKAVHELLDKKASGIFNVVGDQRVSKYEFGCLLADRFALDASLIKKGRSLENRTRVRRPLDMSLSNSKVCEVLGRNLGVIENDIDNLQQQEINGIAQEIKSL